MIEPIENSPSIFDKCQEYTIISNGFSKAFAMTGWRLGWMIVPEGLISIFEKLNEFNVASPSSPAQHAGVVANVEK